MSGKSGLKPAALEFPSEDQLQSAVQTFGMLGDPTRLRILWALLQGEQTVNNLAELVGMQQPTVSQHLAKLRMARLVRQRRQGSHVYYEIEGKHVRPLLRQALGQGDHFSQNLTARSAGSGGPRRKRLDRGVASALSGWSLNHGNAVPAAAPFGFAIDAPAVVGSIAIGFLLLAPLSRFVSLVIDQLGPRSVPFASPALKQDSSQLHQTWAFVGPVVATLAVAGIVLGAILLDISRYDPSGPALAWSPGVAVVSLGAATILRRVMQTPTEDDRVTPVATVGI